MSLKSQLAAGKFAITAEVGPLKGTDVSEIEEVTEILKGKIDAANVTDQQSSVMRLGSLAVSHLINQKGLEPIFQMTCRDRNRIALQSDLLSAWVMGIKNVIALTGDSTAMGDHPEAKPVYDLDSVQLLRTISLLNQGYDLAGNELKGNTDFFSGAVVKVSCDTEIALDLQLMKMRKKIEAGAKFFQTQAIYDVDEFARFMEKAEKFNVPVLAGVIPLKSAGMARFMNKNVSGVCVPDILIKQMAETDNKVQTGIEITADIINKVKGFCHGVHIMAIGWEKKVPQIVEAAGL